VRAFVFLCFSSQGHIYYYHAPTGVKQWDPPPPEQPHGYQMGQNAGGPSAFPAAGPQTDAHTAARPIGGNVFSNASPAGQMSHIGERFKYQQRMSFKVREVFGLATDHFDVVEVQSGRPYFRMKGSFLKIGNKKVLTDANGSSVYALTRSLISLRGRMHISDPSSGQVVMTMRRKGVVPILGTNVVQIWHGPRDEGSPWAEIKVRYIAATLHRRGYSYRWQGTARAAVPFVCCTPLVRYCYLLLNREAL
jgi:hypothetical protein